MARPRPLTQAERAAIQPFVEKYYYSNRYSDDHYEYRHVALPREVLNLIPREYFNEKTGALKLLEEDEWRGLGITQSLGWVHYEIHAPEPHILLFKRPLPK